MQLILLPLQVNEPKKSRGHKNWWLKNPDPPKELKAIQGALAFRDCISLGLCVLLVWLGWPGPLNCQRVHEHLADVPWLRNTAKMDGVKISMVSVSHYFFVCFSFFVSLKMADIIINLNDMQFYTHAHSLSGCDLIYPKKICHPM